MRSTALLLSLASLLWTACSPENDKKPSTLPGGVSTTAPGPRSFGVSVQTMTNPFFVDLTDGLREAVVAHGDELITLDAQFDSLRQQNDISDLILKGVSAIFINPVNWEGIRGSLLRAREKGIPVVVVDAPVKDEALVLCTVASDNVEAGRLAARSILQALGSTPPRIGVLAYSVNKACIDRVEGFKQEISGAKPEKLIEIELSKGSAESGRPVMLDLIGRHPDLNAVFSINDPSALGAISALDAAGKLSGVKVAAVDGAQEAIQAIVTGKLLSSSAQFPREIGKRSAEVIYDHFAGKKVEREVKVRVELITRENAARFVRAK